MEVIDSVTQTLTAVRLAPGFEVIVESGRLALINSLSGAGWDDEFLCQDRLLEVLLRLTDWTPESAALDLFENELGYAREHAETLLEALLASELLWRRRSERIDENELLHGRGAGIGPSLERWLARRSEWERHGWGEAFHFHFTTDFLRKDNYTADPRGLADKAAMKAYLAAEAPPAAYKSYGDKPFTELGEHDAALQRSLPAQAAFEHRVNESGSRQRWNRAELSAFLYLAVGQTRVRKLPITGAHVAKTSPSGGSRHPTECYPFVFDVADVAPGLYHYDVAQHGLRLLRPGDHRSFFQQHVLTHPSRPGFPVAFGLVYAPVFDRSMFRYREPRSYRVIHLDLGHLMQTAALLASASQRPSYRAYTMHEHDVERFIGLDGVRESAMSFAAIG